MDTKEYWNNIYNKISISNINTSFSEFIFSKLGDKNSLVDIGCGNGRDVRYFESKYNIVTGFDDTTKLKIL